MEYFFEIVLESWVWLMFVGIGLSYMVYVWINKKICFKCFTRRLYGIYSPLYYGYRGPFSIGSRRHQCSQNKEHIFYSREITFDPKGRKEDDLIEKRRKNGTITM